MAKKRAKSNAGVVGIVDALAPLAVPISSLGADPANARRHPERNMTALVDSLRRYGQRKPVVARRVEGGPSVVVAGNGTLAAAIRLGWTHLAAVLVDDDPITATGYALADNRTAELAEWDEGALAALLGAIPAEEVAALGWDAADMAALLAGPSAGVACGPGVDDPGGPAEEPPADPVSRAGGVYLLGAHRLMCGDSTHPGDRARLLDPLAQADVAVLDPPYDMAERLWTRLIQDPCILFGQAKHLRAVPDAMWRFERVIDKVTAHRSATVQIGHRHAFVAQVGTVKTLPTVPDTFPSVISCPDRPDHPHEKPVEILVEHLTHWTPPWTSVVDWFAGSGSTLVAAARMGRSALLMERSPAYCDVIRRRWGSYARGAGAEPGDAL